MTAPYKTVEFEAVTLIAIRVLADNYSYLILDKNTPEGALSLFYSNSLAHAVDPVEPDKLLDLLDGKKLKKIFITHHHSYYCICNQFSFGD